MSLNVDYKAIVNDVMRNNPDIRPLEGVELKALQDCLYGMMTDLDVRCRKHGIKLFLVGGTLLGAVRHKGFIPWDDDVDFATSRNDYEKLKEIFESEFSENYELRCPNASSPCNIRFMKIYKKGTVLSTYSKHSPFEPQCVSVDIFPCDYVPQNRICRKIKGIYVNLLMLIASCVSECRYGDIDHLIKNSRSGNVYLYLRMLTGKLFSFHSPGKWFDIVDRKVRYKKKTPCITLAFGRGHYFGELCPENTFFPLKKVPFRDHSFYVPADCRYYLEHLYGKDYMTPPDESRRERHYVKELILD